VPRLAQIRYAQYLLPLLLAACLGYDPTPPPAAKVRFSLDLDGSTKATVKVLDEYDKEVGSAEVSGAGPFEVKLADSRDYGSVRLVATAGDRVLKAVAARVSMKDTVELGKVDGASTGAAQLIQEKVAGQGGSFASVPESAIADLLTQIADHTKQGTAEIKEFFDLVQKIVSSASTAGGAGGACFGETDAALSDTFATAHAKDLPKDVASVYRNKLTAAVGRLTISLVCDAAFVKVMFTVDASGEALDGNGSPQLIRQPTKAGKIYLAITVDESSPVAGAGLLKSQMTPNDPDTVMFDNGESGDEVAGDRVFTRVLVLPRGMRVKYKYTNGLANEGWTRTEEWPGNARILEVRDVLSRSSDGTPDCLVIRRDSYGDEASNKNYVNLHGKIKSGGGALSFDQDLGGAAASEVSEGRYVGGLGLGDTRKEAPLTPAGLPEALENGVCSLCPAPLTMSTDDSVPPELVSAEFTSTSQVVASFSEALEYTSASSAKNYLIIDASQRALAITSVAASGNRVTLDIEPPDFGQSYTLVVKDLKDASANANPLAPEKDRVTIEKDRTAPKIIEVQALPLRDLNPGAKVTDPTVGQVIRVTFSEELDPSSAENVGNYKVQALVGDDLKIHAAHLGGAGGSKSKDRRQVFLVTDVQGKRRPYQLLSSGIRDLAGNVAKVSDPIRFAGFALFRVTFAAVPGFAFLDLAGTKRGLPQGANLYLTGTVLSVARDLEGDNLSVGGRTDITGIPDFEMKKSTQLYKGQPVYTITLLAPPGTYAWKVAHGVPGEFKNPPTTLVKVHKSLCTTNDLAGVNIDPVTLTALPLPGSDGKPISFLDYGAAKLSKSGDDAPGPFVPKSGETLPVPMIMFKRENPDEVCSVRSSDTACPGIVVGTWRDIADFRIGDKTDDYDDGLPEVDPVRLEVDIRAPKLQAVTVRDSESLLLSFDERLAVDATQVKLSAEHAKKGTAIPVQIEFVGGIGSAASSSCPGLLPHQLIVRTGKMEPAAAYTLSYDGLVDVYGNSQPKALEQTWVAPPGYKAFTPCADTSPPKVIAVLPKTPTSLVVQFNEKILPADAKTSHFAISAQSGVAPATKSATLQGGGTAVLLSTGLQAPQAAYTLTVTNISDLATPPNVLTEQKIKFKGFGDFTPPKVLYATAISPTEIAVAFDEALSPLTATAATSYSLTGGVSVQQVSFSGDPSRKASPFGSPCATTDNVVVLAVSKMAAGTSYKLTPSGVTDLSNNACKDVATIKGVAKPPTVDVIFTYRVEKAGTVCGAVPGKAIDPSTLAAQREGVFMLGCTVSTDGKTKGDPQSAVNKKLGYFPPEGSPLTGPEPQLKDDGTGDDAKAGDNVFTIRIPGVPLGTSLQWKAFAPYTVAYKSANPGNAQAAFADSTPGPSVFSDGQEFPGNENAVRILGDKNGDGVVRINSLFGDETTYKKFTNTPPFVWVVDDVTWTP
jgi:hypothetical protein